MIVLYIFGKIILYILSVLLIIIIFVLLVPFKYYFSGDRYDKAELEGSVGWLFGGLKMKFNYSSDSGYNMGMNFLGFNKKSSNKNGKSKSSSNKKDKENSLNKEDNKPAYSYFTYEVIEQGLRIILKVLNHCKPRQFNIDAKVGFDDPMYTGLLYGIRGAGFAILDKYNIKLKPTFEEEDFKGSFIIGGSIQIFYLLLVVIEFMLTKPFRGILFKNIKIKIKRRLKKWRIISISTKTWV